MGHDDTNKYGLHALLVYYNYVVMENVYVTVGSILFKFQTAF